MNLGRYLFLSVGVGAICQEQDCKQLCKRIVYTLVFDVYAFGSRTERSGERLPKAAGGLIEARNAAVE